MIRTYYSRSLTVLGLAVVIITGTIMAIWFTQGKATTDLRLPAERDEQGAVVISWPMAYELYWPAYANLLYALLPLTEVVILVPDGIAENQVRTYLAANGLTTYTGLAFRHVATSSFWIRDYGPIYALDEQGRSVSVDAIYAPQQRIPPSRDDEIPAQLADLAGIARHELELVLDGGNVISDGQGGCLTTITLFTRNPHHRRAAIQSMLRNQLGCERLTVLPALDGEPTGHVSLIVKLPGGDRALVGACTANDDPNCAVLDQVAASLESLSGPEGGLYQVERVALPRVTSRQGEPVYASYVNSLIIEDVILVPTFGLPYDQAALAAYERAAPHAHIVPVDLTALRYAGGALQCITIRLPINNSSLGMASRP